MLNFDIRDLRTAKWNSTRNRRRLCVLFSKFRASRFEGRLSPYVLILGRSLPSSGTITCQRGWVNRIHCPRVVEPPTQNPSPLSFHSGRGDTHHRTCPTEHRGPQGDTGHDQRPLPYCTCGLGPWRRALGTINVQVRCSRRKRRPENRGVCGCLT